MRYSPAPFRWPLIAVTEQMRFSMQNVIVNEIEKREEIKRRESKKESKNDGLATGMAA